jgi:hypothetical protein
MDFSNDELNLLCIYNAGSRKETLEELASMRKYLAPDEAELTDLTDSVIEKLKKITDEEYDKLDLVPDFDEE